MLDRVGGGDRIFELLASLVRGAVVEEVFVRVGVRAGWIEVPVPVGERRSDISRTRQESDVGEVAWKSASSRRSGVTKGGAVETLVG